MKIAIFHNLPSGGAKRALCEWTRRLVRRHTVDEYTLSTADQNYCELRPHVRTTHVYPFRRSPSFASPFGRLNQLQRWRELRRLDTLTRGIAGHIDDGEYDLVFAHSCAFTTIPKVLRYLRSPATYYLHEPFGLASPPVATRRNGRLDGLRERADRVDPLIGLYARSLEESQARSLRAVDVLLANSSFTSDEMRVAYHRSSVVCQYGVDTDVFRPLERTATGSYVLSVGELSPRKGFTFLVEALAQLPEGRRPPLWLACNMVIPSERRRVERLAAERGVDLEISENVETGALVRLYSGAAVCVYAPIREPFGMVPLEAMACGTPVVAVREGGLVESVVDGHTGRLVERDPNAFAAAVEDLLSHPARAAEWGRSARAHAKMWTWERSVEALEQQFRLAG